ncbi:hypothetical protein [Halorubrum sp. DTA98]|uniref:hypothetical protein n=1 Tax=Halorubrum sp. DTA98 TaxID=3402163 RepID=UPI003AAC4AB6
MRHLPLLRRAIRNPGRILTELNRRYHTRGSAYNTDGVDVFAEDWDTLVLLDACRFDEFKRQSELSGTLRRRTSRGATSAEFVRGNFANRRLHDVVYVSANGWFPKLQDEINAEVHEFVLVERDAVQGLTSKPETVTDRAIEAIDEYPTKRHIVHYMQPHQPYLGPLGEKLTFGSTLAETVERNGLSRRDVIRAYRENLQLALDAVERLADTIDGKTVISADHGEHLGERERPLPVRFYGHMEGLYTSELVDVPWHVLEFDRRRRIIAEEPDEGRTSIDIEAVERNLRDLGYKV